MKTILILAGVSVLVYFIVDHFQNTVADETPIISDQEINTANAVGKATSISSPVQQPKMNVRVSTNSIPQMGTKALTTD